MFNLSLSTIHDNNKTDVATHEWLYKTLWTVSKVSSRLVLFVPPTFMDTASVDTLYTFYRSSYLCHHHAHCLLPDVYGTLFVNALTNLLSTRIHSLKYDTSQNNSYYKVVILGDIVAQLY